MSVAFFFLIWVSSPSGGHSEFFGDLQDCETRRQVVLAYLDTLYLSKCIPVELAFVKGVPQEYQKPSEIPPQ